MALELKQSLKLSQQLIMTPQLQQAIRLLQLNRMELAEHCLAEMMENPMLEESVDVDEKTNEEREKLKTNDDQVKEVDPSTGEGTDDINWENYLNSQRFETRGDRMAVMRDDDGPTFEANFSRASTLSQHLLSQLQLTKMIAADRDIGEAIIGNLDDDGYLRLGVEDIAEKMNVDVEDVEAVLGKVHELDPVGVGARSLKECLLLQARNLNEDQELITYIIENHLGDLEKRNYAKVMREAKASKARVNRAIRQILSLEPKPGRQFYDESANYITPDIYIYHVNGDYVIVQNDDGLPRLRISKLYQSVLSEVKVADGAKEYINEKLKSALWLIRSIHQRQRTIYKVTESIVKMQREFLDNGVKDLKPMVLRDIAADIGMHESTVSRVTTSKYVHTPQGLFELKFFFNAGIKRVHGTSVASEAVKEKIRELVQKENHSNPYSDQELVELLRKGNIDIARRTVAKYREMLGILSSSKRKQML